ncbi:MAG: hypothetical protein IPL18_14415 [Sphingomonadales bacterium]|nr:hypothetical protein [Sphingomonadales bacterium]
MVKQAKDVQRLFLGFLLLKAQSRAIAKLIDLPPASVVANRFAWLRSCQSKFKAASQANLTAFDKQYSDRHRRQCGDAVNRRLHYRHWQDHSFQLEF